MKRVMLYIDDQNMYRGARRTFFPNSYNNLEGQFNPVEMGNIISQRIRPGGSRELVGIRIYTGRPNKHRNRVSYSANRRQCAQWESWGADIYSRPLRYNWSDPNSKGEQKGVDVSLAIDFVAGAIDGWYDVGIIASTDTDLIPALEFVKTRPNLGREIEVVAWREGTSYKRIDVSGGGVWCHQLSRTDYDGILDSTNYVQ